MVTIEFEFEVRVRVLLEPELKIIEIGVRSEFEIPEFGASLVSRYI